MTMKQQPSESTLAVIVDGAAFGPYISSVLQYARKRKMSCIF